MEPTDDEVRALAQEILNAEAYAKWRQPRGALAEWLEAWNERARDAWSAVLEWLSGLFPDAVLDETWMIFLFCLAVGTTLGFLAVYSFRRMPRRAVSQGPELGPDFETRLLEEASSLDQAGRSLEAAHVLQLAVLELLIRRGWLTLERSEPNVTLRRRLEASELRPSARHELVTLIDRLERAWFRDRGAAAAQQDLYGGWLAFYRGLRSVGPTA